MNKDFRSAGETRMSTEFPPRWMGKPPLDGLLGVSSGRKAFTIAEILISLTVIGVVAAITLPAVLYNVNDAAWKTEKKGLLNRLSQAVSVIPRLDGFGVSDTEYNIATKGLNHALNLSAICKQNSECGFPSEVKGADGEKMQYYEIADLRTFFLMPGGESVGIAYNPGCFDYDMKKKAKSLTSLEEMACVNFVYDLNGDNKGPNQMGKDVGIITAFYPEDSLLVDLSNSVVKSSKSNGTKGRAQNSNLVSAVLNDNNTDDKTLKKLRTGLLCTASSGVNDRNLCNGLKPDEDTGFSGDIQYVDTGYDSIENSQSYDVLVGYWNSEHDNWSEQKKIRILTKLMELSSTPEERTHWGVIRSATYYQQETEKLSKILEYINGNSSSFPPGNISLDNIFNGDVTPSTLQQILPEGYSSYGGILKITDPNTDTSYNSAPDNYDNYDNLVLTFAAPIAVTNTYGHGASNWPNDIKIQCIKSYIAQTQYLIKTYEVCLHRLELSNANKIKYQNMINLLNRAMQSYEQELTQLQLGMVDKDTIHKPTTQQQQGRR